MYGVTREGGGYPSSSSDTTHVHRHTTNRFPENEFLGFFNCFFFKDPIDFDTWEKDLLLVSL